METKSKIALGCLWIVLVGLGSIWIGMASDMAWVGWTCFVIGCSLLLLISAAVKAIKQGPQKVDTKFVSEVQAMVEPHRVTVESLLNQVQGVTSFAEVQAWDSRAADAIRGIQEMLVSAEQHLSEVQNAPEPSDKKVRKQREHEAKVWTASKQGLEQLEELLQEKIDFTPNDKDEQKALIGELTEQKRQLQLQKISPRRSVRFDAKPGQGARRLRHGSALSSSA